MKRPPRHRRRPKFELFEARRPLAAGNDFYEFKSDGDLYADEYFLSTADPVLPTIDAAGRRVFDFSLNRSGDQTADMTFAEGYQPTTRLKIDPTESYQFAFIGYVGEGAFVVEAFDSGEQSLGQIQVPFVLPSLEGLNFFRYANLHAMIGPAGTQLPAQTAWIDLVSPPQSPYTRFGFVEDYAFSFQTDRSVDQLTAPVTLGVDPADSYALSAKAIDHSKNLTTVQQHSLGYIGLDADRFIIEPVHTQKYGSSADAKLASPLNPGDMFITLTTTEGWSNTSFDPSTRALAWYGYRDTFGTQYPEFTYTRNVARDASDGLWSRGGIQGNRISLNTAWTGPALPAGTAMRNAVDGAPLVAALLDHAALKSTMTATLQGQWSGGIPVSGQFAPGTKYIQLSATINQSSVTEDARISVRMQFDRNESVVIASPENHRRVVTLDVLANDGSTATGIVGITDGKRGSVEIGSDARQLVYRSHEYFIGTDAFTYESVDSSGNRTTHQVLIKSLGSNLDGDPTLQTAVATAALTPTQYHPNVQMPHSFAGVKDQTLTSSLFGNWVIQTHAHRLDEIGFQAGSLSLRANGDFEYAPIPGEAYRFPFLNTASNGSDSQPAINVITISESEFRRDQTRLADLGLSVANFESAYKRLFYSGGLPLDTNGRPFLSWRVHLLPFLGYQELYDRFKQDEPWNSANNLPLLAEMPEIFRSGSDAPGVTSTRYQAIASSTFPSPLPFLLNNADGRGDLLQLNKIRDGIENTLLIVQAGADKAVPWTQNVDLAFDQNDPVVTLGNVGAYFNAYILGFGARALPTDMGGATFQSLATAAQGDLADPATIFRQSRSRSDFPGDGKYLNSQFQTDQMKTLVLGMHNHESATKKFAPSTATSQSTFSWRVWLLPYIGQQTLFNEFHLDEAWDSPHNLSVASRMPDLYRSLGDDASTTTTRFRVLGGAGMAYGHADALRQGPRLSSFTDGSSNSILIVEAGTDKAVPWTMPEVLPVDLADFWASLGSLPDDELLMGMADGSTARASHSTANELMIGLATINRGDSNRAAFQAAQGVLVPSLPMQTTNDLKQVGLAVHNFESTFRFLPMNFAGGVNTLPTAGNVGLSWRVAILPYLEESALYNQFHLNEPWDSPHNLSLLPLMPAVFSTDSEKFGEYTTRVQRFSGPDTIDPNQKLGFRHITDGTSNTILAGLVAPEKAVPWTKPDDIEFSKGDGWEVVGNTHFMPVLIADGSVSNLHFDEQLGMTTLWDYGPQNLEMLLTRNGGEVSVGTSRTFVIAEDEPFAISVKSPRPLLLELAEPVMATVTSQSEGYQTGYGGLQRITVEANNDRNGKRQTKLYVRSVWGNPDSPPTLVETIDLIIVDRDLPPTVDPTPDMVMAEDSNSTTIQLTGISAGGREQQPVSVSARTLTPALIDRVTVDYQPGSSSGSIAIVPVAEQSGAAAIEVMVTDAGADGDLQTTSDNSVIKRTVSLDIRAVNDPPQVGSLDSIEMSEDSRAQVTTITGINAGPDETQPLRVTATTSSLLLSLASTNLVLTGSSANLRWTPVADRFGEAIVLIQVEDGGLDSDLETVADNAVTTSSLTVTITPQNDAPFIARPANQTIVEDTSELQVPLQDFGAGPYEFDEVRITASTGNPLLVPELSVQRLPGSDSALLKIAPQPNQAGSTMITLSIEDGGADNDLATTADNLVTQTAFELTIQPVNDSPELGVIENLLIDSGTQDVTVALTGISAGDGELQPLQITASTDASQILSAPQIQYLAGASTASLKFSTLGTGSGQGTIRVVVEDGGLDGNLATKTDNLSITRQFTVVVNVPPVASDDRFRIGRDTATSLNVLVNDVDESDTLTVVITDLPPSDQATVQVNSDNTIQFIPADNYAGVVTFAYQVVDQHGRSSAAAEVTVGVSQSRYQNPFDSLDVNSDGHVTAMDALLIINMLNDPNHPKNESEYTGTDDLDASGDGNFSAIDALLVINRLNR